MSSIATLFGFWIASVSMITYCSSSNKDVFFNSFLYMLGMTVSFYVLKYILGFFVKRFSGEFPTMLFLAYSAMAYACGIGSSILYFWNKENLFGSVLCALPASGMLAEAIGCLMVLWNRKMLLGIGCCHRHGVFYNLPAISAVRKRIGNINATVSAENSV